MSASARLPITVVMRSYNDAVLLPRVLAALDAQVGVDITLFVFESASTDDSVSILEQHGYARIEHLAPGSYHSSNVLNQGVSWAETELVAFVNSDAVLMSEDVLRQLAEALLNDPSCAGAFAQQLPRRDASALTLLDYHVAFTQRHQLGQDWDHLSLVTSMIRKAAWENNHFDPALTYAEDYVWSARAKAQGWTLRYVPQAQVEHSHNYTPQEMYRRSYGDAAALSILDTGPPPDSALWGVVWPYAKRMLRDTWRLKQLGHLEALSQLPRYRWSAQLGAWRGRRDAHKQKLSTPHGRQPTAQHE